MKDRLGAPFLINVRGRTKLLFHTLDVGALRNSGLMSANTLFAATIAAAFTVETVLLDVCGGNYEVAW